MNQISQYLQTQNVDAFMIHRVPHKIISMTSVLIFPCEIGAFKGTTLKPAFAALTKACADEQSTSIIQHGPANILLTASDIREATAMFAALAAVYVFGNIPIDGERLGR